MKARTYQEMTDHIIGRIRQMQISLDDRVALVGMLTALQTRHEMDCSSQTVETNTFDEEEIHENCTVQILRNSVTGEVSVGWWENEEVGE